MNISPALMANTHSAGVVESRIGLPDAREFSSQLTIGQIIKGRVLLHYDGDRYLVAFDGRERIVDSNVPLSTGDLLRGRVIAIGDRVELQRLPNDRDDRVPPAVAKEQIDDLSVRRRTSAPAADVDAFFARYQADLSKDGREALVRMMLSAPDRNSVLLAGLTLAKLGLPQNEVLLQAITTALKKSPAAQPVDASERLRNLVSGPELVTQLKELVRQTLAPSTPESDPLSPANGRAAPQVAQSGTAQDSSMKGDRQATSQLGNLLLNAQSGGSIGHKFGTLPLLVNDRLVEVDVAVFEHEREANGRSDVRHRALVFVLNLQTLGRVEVAATVVEDRLRVRIGSEKAESATWISRHAEALREALTGAGWAVDEVAYETLGAQTSNASARSVIENVIARDSVNRLV